MLEAFFNALSGLRTSSRKIENSAHNVANLQTTGFKKSQVNLSDQKTGGVSADTATRSNSQGSIIQTNDPLDITVNGNGYFKLALPNGGTGFTRAGSFKLDSEGKIVTAGGEALAPKITVPGNATSVSINSNGEVSVFVGGDTVDLGQIELADFNNPGGLTAAGANVLLESSASGQPLSGNPGTGGFGELISGALELSNVDITEEIVDQILAKNAFKANANVIKTADKMLGTLLDIKS